MTSQDMKKTAERTTFLEHCINWSAREPRTKATLEAKGIITWLPLARSASMGKDIKRNTHPVIRMCIRLYIQ